MLAKIRIDVAEILISKTKGLSTKLKANIKQCGC